MAKTLEELQDENLPRADVESVSIHIGLEDTPEEHIEAAEAEREKLIGHLNDYLQRFTPGEVVRDPGPLGGGILCPMCGRALSGFFGTFEWTIRHGEGRCTKCGYPARGIHYVKDEDGNEVVVIRRFILPYHPDELKEVEKDD